MSLKVEPRHHAVVSNATDPWAPGIEVQPGPLHIFVGGGQPGFAKVLNATAEVAGVATLTQAYRCRAGGAIGMT